jgi:hypothetical protein
MRILMAVVIACCWPLLGYAAELDNWPGKSEGFGPPFFSFEAGTSGAFVRAKEGTAAHQFFIGYLSGYISGVNQERPYGGNVLGTGSPKIVDFALMVRTYCAEHPLERLESGIGVSLKKLKPATWRDLQ